MKLEALDKLEKIRKAQLQRDLPYRKIWREVSDWIDPTYGKMDIDLLETTDFNQKMTTDFNQYKCHRIQPISKMQ